MPSDLLRRLARRSAPAFVQDAVRRSATRSISMVRREPAISAWFRRRMMRQKPVLFHFEIHITDHCNLNCRGCAHFSNLCKPAFADPAEFERDVRAMASSFSRIEQVYLLGGEPLLHPEVDRFVRIARAALPETRISLMTNGTLVTRASDALWRALAETETSLLCDDYPVGLPKEEIASLGRRHGVNVEWTEPRREFFKIPIDPEARHDPHDSFWRCQGYNNCPIVRDGRIYPCAFVAYADILAERFGKESLLPGPADSMSILDADGDAVMRFLLRPVPWCAHCDMQHMSFYEWGRSRRSPDEWLVTDDGPTAP